MGAERSPVRTAVRTHGRGTAGRRDVEFRAVMERRKLKREADELLGYGYTHQQVFDQLVLEFPAKKPKKIAELLSNRPSQDARQRYRTLHLALLLIIALNGVLKVMHTWDPAEIERGFSYRWINVVPIATVLVGYGLYLWQGELFRWIGWVNAASGLGLLGHLSRLPSGRFDAWGATFDALALAIGLIILYLQYNAFPKYKEHKDPQGGPSTFVFQQEVVGRVFR